MALLRTGYQLIYEALSDDPATGLAAIVPWDTEIFGFPVASFRTGSGEQVPDTEIFQHAFSSWAHAQNVAVCSAVVRPSLAAWRNLLAQTGFEFVDLSLQVTLSLASAKIPSVQSQLRLAVPADQAVIEKIAAGSFSHGRYHADPRFPEDLANRRYSHWVRNALIRPNDVDRVYVLEKEGTVVGFYHLTIEGEVCDLRLAAVAPEYKNTMLGVELYAAVLGELRQQKIRRIVTSISAMNTNVMNLYSMLGFRFGTPELVYHWHARQEPR
jgi:L-amino acid N-acyltransferase YncA